MRKSARSLGVERTSRDAPKVDLKRVRSPSGAAGLDHFGNSATWEAKPTASFLSRLAINLAVEIDLSWYVETMGCS
jgi:hypothetical protein